MKKQKTNFNLILICTLIILLIIILIILFLIISISQKQNLTYTYPTETNVSCNGNNLYRNGIQVPNPESAILGVGKWKYTCGNSNMIIIILQNKSNSIQLCIVKR